MPPNGLVSTPKPFYFMFGSKPCSRANCSEIFETMLIELRGAGVRNLENFHLEPHPKLNIIYGENAAGKTSLLEAIYFSGTGKSFRTSATQNIISFGDDTAWIKALIRSCSTRFTDNISITRHRNTKTVFKVNNRASASISEIARTLPIQAIHPETYQLITGSPVIRRTFLNKGCFYIDETFIKTWKRYNLALKQRNAHLRGKTQPQVLTAIEKELQESGTLIDRIRQNFIATLNNKLSENRKIWPHPKLRLLYQRGWSSSVELAESLHDSRKADIKAGYTSPGPHRADMILQFEGQNVKDFFSRSQLKLASITLLIIQLDIIQDATHKDCVLLIDDLSSELDSLSRDNLLNEVHDSRHQCFLTSLQKDDFNQSNPMNHKMFHVKHGRIIES